MTDRTRAVLLTFLLAILLGLVDLLVVVFVGESEGKCVTVVSCALAAWAGLETTRNKP